MEKCIVHKCSNHKHQGTFVGDICAPCHKTITTGEIIHSDNFIAELNDSKESFMKCVNDFAEINWEQHLLIVDMQNYIAKQVLKEMEEYPDVSKSIN